MQVERSVAGSGRAGSEDRLQLEVSTVDSTNTTAIIDTTRPEVAVRLAAPDLLTNLPTKPIQRSSSSVSGLRLDSNGDHDL